MGKPIYCSLSKVVFGAFTINGSCALDGNGVFTGGSYTIYGPGANVRRLPVALDIFLVTEEGLVAVEPGQSIAIDTEVLHRVFLNNGDSFEVGGLYAETPVVVNGKVVLYGGMSQRSIVALWVNGKRIFPGRD